MTEIQVYQFKGHSVRVAVADPDRPEWVAADVCGALGYDRNHRSEALEGLDPDEKGNADIVTPGGLQEMVTVTEPGLYSLILRSRKPAAKEFKRWVTHEVLPSIRKTGVYGHAAPHAPVDLAALAGAVAAVLLPQVKALLACPVASQPVVGPAEGRRINAALTRIGRDLHLAFPEQPAAHYRQTEALELREATNHWGPWAELPASEQAGASRWLERRQAKTTRLTGPRRQQSLAVRN